MTWLQATGQSWESCNIYVANNPQAFVESYWEVNYLDVYDVVGSESGQPSRPAPQESKSSYAGAVWPATWTPPAPFSTISPIPTIESHTALSGVAHTETLSTTIGLPPRMTKRVGPPQEPDA